MNSIVAIESILAPSVAISPEHLFGTGQIETIVSAIESQVRAEAFEIQSEEGRERVKSIAYKIARSKTILDDMGKEHVAEIKKQAGAIDAERRGLRDRLDALKEEVRGPLTKWEEDEANRISGHENALALIVGGGMCAPGLTAVGLRENIAAVANASGRDWQEFKARADEAITDALHKLNAALAAAEQREKDAAELEALRKEKAERDARDAADRQRAAQEQAEKERQARRDHEERERLAQLEQWKAEQAERAKREAEEAAALAVEQERARVAADEARKAREKAGEEAAERKRQENKRHRAKIHNEICADLIAAGVPNDIELVQGIVKALAAGTIRHLSINY